MIWKRKTEISLNPSLFLALERLEPRVVSEEISTNLTGRKTWWRWLPREASGDQDSSGTIRVVTRQTCQILWSLGPGCSLSHPIWHLFLPSGKSRPRGSKVLRNPSHLGASTPNSLLPTEKTRSASFNDWPWAIGSLGQEVTRSPNLWSPFFSSLHPIPSFLHYWEISPQMPVSFPG